MNPEDHFVLVPEASRVIDKQTGASYGTHEVMKILRHPMLARDQLFEQKEAKYNQQPNGDQDPLSAEDLIQFVRICMAKLPGPEQQEFMAQLADLVSTAPSNGNGGMDGNLSIFHRGNGNGRDQMPNGNGVLPNNQGALDRRRRNSARDNRRPGMDANIRH